MSRPHVARHHAREDARLLLESRREFGVGADERISSEGAVSRGSTRCAMTAPLLRSRSLTLRACSSSNAGAFRRAIRHARSSARSGSDEPPGPARRSQGAARAPRCSLPPAAAGGPEAALRRVRSRSVVIDDEGGSLGPAQNSKRARFPRPEPSSTTCCAGRGSGGRRGRARGDDNAAGRRVGQPAGGAQRWRVPPGRAANARYRWGVASVPASAARHEPQAMDSDARNPAELRRRTG